MRIAATMKKGKRIIRAASENKISNTLFIPEWMLYNFLHRTYHSAYYGAYLFIGQIKIYRQRNFARVVIVCCRVIAHFIAKPFVKRKQRQRLEMNVNCNILIKNFLNNFITLLFINAFYPQRLEMV